RERLFQPFSAGQSRSGSGLGLMICREIVTALGGQITLDNRMQHARVAGLDAIVRLPLASAESARTDAVRAGPDGSRTA
ncbi:MAG: HAMP domain-containing histidine kinase, partial [Rhodoferax sp.]|nr:HAMP domain-containing histidine kinase [Rhodoferax sp.]